MNKQTGKIRFIYVLMFFFLVCFLAVKTNIWADAKKDCIVTYNQDALSDGDNPGAHPNSLNLFLSYLMKEDEVDYCQSKITLDVPTLVYSHQVYLKGVSDFTFEGQAAMSTLNFSKSSGIEPVVEGEEVVTTPDGKKCGVVIGEQANNVTINNLIISGAEVGICIFGDNVKLGKVTLTNNTVGVYVAEGAILPTFSTDVKIVSNSAEGLIVDQKDGSQVVYEEGTDPQTGKTTMMKVANNGLIQIRTNANLGIEAEMLIESIENKDKYKLMGRVFRCDGADTIDACTNDGVLEYNTDQCAKQIGYNPGKFLMFISKENSTTFKDAWMSADGDIKADGSIVIEIDKTTMLNGTASFFLVAVGGDGAWSTSSKVYNLSKDFKLGLNQGVCKKCEKDPASCAQAAGEGEADPEQADGTPAQGGGSEGGMSSELEDKWAGQPAGTDPAAVKFFSDSDCAVRIMSGFSSVGSSPIALIEFSLDSDSDGLQDKYEDRDANCYRNGPETDPYNPDSDGDGIADGAEVPSNYVKAWQIVGMPPCTGSTEKINILTGVKVCAKEIPKGAAEYLTVVDWLNSKDVTSNLDDWTSGQFDALTSNYFLKATEGMQLAYGNQTDAYFIENTSPIELDTDMDGKFDGAEDRAAYFELENSVARLYKLQSGKATGLWKPPSNAVNPYGFNPDGTCELIRPIDYNDIGDKYEISGRDYIEVLWDDGKYRYHEWLVCQYDVFQSSNNFDGQVNLAESETDPRTPDSDFDGVCDGLNGAGCNQLVSEVSGPDMCPNDKNVVVNGQVTDQCPSEGACYDSYWTFSESNNAGIDGMKVKEFITQFETTHPTINFETDSGDIGTLSAFDDTDDDGIPNLIEAFEDNCNQLASSFGLNPRDADVDKDGFCDGPKNGNEAAACIANDPCLNDKLNKCVQSDGATGQPIPDKYGNYVPILRTSFINEKALYCVLDFDGDGLVNCVENPDFNNQRSPQELDPYKKDTDEDGLDDNIEFYGIEGVVGEAGGGFKLSATETDSDDDGAADGVETGMDGDPTTYNKVTNKTGQCHKGINDNGTPSDIKDDIAPVDYKIDTDPTLEDTDGDGLPDGIELKIGTDPNSQDSDNDGAVDFCKADLPEGAKCELKRSDFYDPALDVDVTDPCNSDTDGDGIVDGQDMQPLVEFGFNGNSQCRKSETNKCSDIDGDLLCDRCEDEWAIEMTCHYMSDNPDTDGDGILDGDEDLNSNGTREPGETDPCKTDTDGDGIADNIEKLTTCLDASNPDTDGDCILDGVEDSNMTGTNSIGTHDGQYRAPFETDPCVPDTDGDGLWDGNINGTGEDLNCNGLWEPKIGETDPRNFDTDGDGRSDWIESCKNKEGAMNCIKKQAFVGNVNRQALNYNGGCSLVASDEAKPNLILIFMMMMSVTVIALVRLLKNKGWVGMLASAKKANE